jgi:hypothetical protein
MRPEARKDEGRGEAVRPERWAGQEKLGLKARPERARDREEREARRLQRKKRKESQPQTLKIDCAVAQCTSDSTHPRIKDVDGWIQPQ